MLPDKNSLIDAAEVKIKEIEEEYQTGLITPSERRRLTTNVWLEVTEKLANLTWDLFDKNDMVRIIAESGGARAGKDQIKQLAAMRGLIYDPRAEFTYSKIERPSRKLDLIGSSTIRPNGSIK